MSEQEKELSIYYRDLKRKITADCIKIVEACFDMERKRFEKRTISEQKIIGDNYNVMEIDMKNQMKELI